MTRAYTRRYTPEERFWQKVVKHPSGCWEWIGARNPSGYGHLGVDGKTVYAHRFAYILLIGPIPAGLEIDHLCRVRACVNPGHLEPVTPKVNNFRSDSLSARNARKSHCEHGHPLDDRNTYSWVWSRTGRMERMCRTCRRERNRRTSRQYREPLGATGGATGRK